MYILTDRGIMWCLDTDSGDVSSPTRSAPRPTRARRRRRGGSRAAIAVLRTPGLVPRALRLVPGLLRQIQWGHVSVNAAFGFEDPATTGRTYGAIAPLLVAGGARGWPVRCRPVFGREEALHLPQVGGLGEEPRGGLQRMRQRV